MVLGDTRNTRSLRFIVGAHVGGWSLSAAGDIEPCTNQSPPHTLASRRSLSDRNRTFPTGHV